MTRAEKMAVIYTVAAHYHSGQGSRGYRLICRISSWQRRSPLRNPPLFVGPEAIKLHDDLVARYGDKL